MNLTKKFLKYIDKKNKNISQDYIYLFVPGFLSHQYNIDQLFLFFKNLNLKYKKIKIDEKGCIEKNCEIIRETLLKYKKYKGKIVLIGHSRGGVECATSIAKYNLYEYIKTLILIQTPWYGAIIAEAWFDHISASVSKIAEILYDTDTQNVKELTYKMRKKMIKKYPLDLNKVKTICFSSYTEHGIGPLNILSKYLKTKYGKNNDSVVCPEDAIIKGSDYILLPNIDHANPVLDKLWYSLKSKDIFYALLCLV